jgi:hypothetical protein
MLKIFLKYSIAVLLIIVVGFCLWTWGALTYTYSSGERAGYIQKFSKRGWIFKTWEGELSMVNLPGAMQEKFSFSVRKPDVVEKIQKSMGSRVVLNYSQHRGIPINIFGETSYFLEDVRQVEENLSLGKDPVSQIN